MMKKIFLTCLLLVVITISTFAQTFSGIAYVNTSELINSLPQKKEASEKLALLNKNYKNELQVMQNEYNKKYSDFVTYQNTLAENIKVRRMQELTELEMKIETFTEVIQKDLEEQEKVLLEPLRTRVMNAIKAVGIEQNLTVIYDTSDKGIVFVSPNAQDINRLVRNKLGYN